MTFPSYASLHGCFTGVGDVRSVFVSMHIWFVLLAFSMTKL